MTAAWQGAREHRCVPSFAIAALSTFNYARRRAATGPEQPVSLLRSSHSPGVISRLNPRASSRKSPATLVAAPGSMPMIGSIKTAPAMSKAKTSPPPFPAKATKPGAHRSTCSAVLALDASSSSQRMMSCSPPGCDHEAAHSTDGGQ